MRYFRLLGWRLEEVTREEYAGAVSAHWSDGAQDQLMQPDRGFIAEHAAWFCVEVTSAGHDLPVANSAGAEATQ